MKTKSIEWWNSLKKNADTNTIAEEGDLVCLISGMAFLIQRKQGFNNIVLLKVRPSKKKISLLFSALSVSSVRKTKYNISESRE